MTAALRTGPRRIVVVVAIAVVMVIAGGLGTYLLIVHPRSIGSGVVDDGPTFYQVLSEVNSSVQSTLGGPWSLFSVIGLEAQIPFSPNVRGYPALNLSVNSCQQLINGVTVWNGSVPVFHGTFNSGTAPFWQLGYYSNVTKSVLIATSISGLSHVYPPIPLASGCVHAWTDFPSSPEFWATQIYSNNSLPVDSPIAAAVAWKNIDRNWIEENQPLVEVFSLGPALFTATGNEYGGSWGDYFMGCGLADVSGIHTLYAAEVSRSGGWEGASNGTTNCAILKSSGPAVDRGLYELVFLGATPSNGSETVWLTSSFQVALAYLNGTIYAYDGWGLANWMTSWNLLTSWALPLPLGTSTCGAWVASIADCPANSSGWFAVVLSATGEWVNSYGVLPNGTIGWSEPVTALVSHQQLVVVVPSSWNLTDDVLSVNSTVTTSAVLGWLTL